jgi:hypothetical protein
MGRTCSLAVILTLLGLALAFNSASARWNPTEQGKKGFPDLQRVMVTDGSTVHNVGELQMHVGNWGIFGSMPGSGYPFSEAPSAQWPAGSGVEYLYVAGLWVGAMKGGVPAVSTAAYQAEFRPTQDPIDKIYRSAEGVRGGNRLPSPDADDDKDGKVDEDWLNGHDDDHDGKIDEDYAAISKQMFSCWYTDNQPISIQIYPEHNPLNLLVRQESYQWEEDRFDDFVGVEYHITNIGTDILEDLYIGFFADGDAGPRGGDNYWEDDATGHTAPPPLCTDLGPVMLDIAYTYDADQDQGATPGYFGIMFLGHTTDPTGETAPKRVGISTYANFSGSQSFEEGGDPTNDFERYELLSQKTIERDAVVPRDYRMLMSAGPFKILEPESTLVFQTAFVCGAYMEGMITNASAAQLCYDGAWFDLNPLPGTGVDGRETPVTGPAENVAIDTCRVELRNPIPSIPRGQTIWINNDCARERDFQMMCGYTDADSAKFRTGVGGKETQLHWIVGTAPPPPSMRIWTCALDQGGGHTGVAIIWDNFSESVPDVKTQQYDFEGYRVWRADNWTRPLGTSAENGPGAELWKLLFQADVINNFGEDTGLEQYRYEPLKHLLSPTQKADFIQTIKQYLLEFPDGEPPCPQGVTSEVCDTLVKLAKWDLGVLGGRQYYMYVDYSMHLGRPYFYSVTALDHGYADKGTGLTEGKVGDPSSNFRFVEPTSYAQPSYSYDEGKIYVVPNPATRESLAPWTLEPNNDDPTGIKIEFRNLPRTRGIIRVYTLAGDLVKELPFDANVAQGGTMKWDLVSRNAQDCASGVYLYSVESDDKNFKRFVGKFVVIR